MAENENQNPPKRSRLTLDHDNEVVRLVRELPPAHFTLKLESFSLLQETHRVYDGENHFDSTEFRAGGYKWVLSVYPNGNENEDGAGHLSLSVRMVDKLSFGTTINVALRFFVLDQIRDKYLAILDLKEKRFQTIKNEWGIPKVLPLSSFSDPSNGYLVDDCCVLGAEVLVVDGEKYASQVSVVEASENWTHTWRIEKFSELKDPIYSPGFTFEGWSWMLYLHPRGYAKNKDKNISLTLILDYDFNPTEGSKVFANGTLCCKNQHGGSYHEKTLQSWFSLTEDEGGDLEFLPLSEVNNPENGYVVDDVMIIKVEIKEIFLLKEFGKIYCANKPNACDKRNKLPGRKT